MSATTLLLTTLAVTSLAFAVLWLASLLRDDCSVVDVYWGPGFVVIGWIGILSMPDVRATAVIVVLAVTVWGLRLGAHLTARFRRSSSEDSRYAAMRAKAGPSFRWTSLVTVFLLQAAILWAIAAPIHVVVIGSDAPPARALVAIGLLVFLAGFALEVLADAALARFRREAENRGQLLTTGLFGWVRHPNYLGEIVLWWGIGLMAFAGTRNILAFAGPLLLTLLILFVSGVPMLDRSFRQRQGYEAWAARTPALWPRLRRPG
jgi:steroid 5-alpha reductase family enzyme